MAKKKENKNRSYREMIRRRQDEMNQLEKQRRKEWESGMGIIMFALSIVNLALVMLAIFKLIDSNLLFVWAGAELIYGVYCFIGHIKDPDAVIKRMCIIMFSCVATLVITALICG